MDDSQPTNEFDILADIIRAVNHLERLKILETLHHQPNLTVSQLSSRLNIHRSIISQHCKALKDCKIIKPLSQEHPNKLTNNYDKLTRIHNALSTFSKM